MNTRIIEIRALDKKTEGLQVDKNIIPKGKSWIESIRKALGMTALQFANRLGVTQPRITVMEKNEKNLKISTMEKIAKAIDCDFVYYFKPKTSFQSFVEVQARKKAEKIIKSVNLNMALENQDIATKEAVEDMVADFINNKTKQIWN
ncbi:mobile mystery protein A [Treponema parvum]|uniref:mobile mystery protein A n=1 Tax=Treponema parvum TaxID=138851 RepID=UPI001AEBBD02|nr:mobile mystery protein A [Treponema parvum]QTQ16614.1 mobile mystery protein A [Treponema parvum]